MDPTELQGQNPARAAKLPPPPACRLARAPGPHQPPPVHVAPACLAVALLVSACGPAAAPPPATPAGARLTAAERAAIGRKIWHNECGGTVAGLTSWNAGEEFPSLGIGHFIWYPAGFRGPFHESWPDFVAFARTRGANLPPLATLPDCPWPTRAAFQAAQATPDLAALRNWLAGNVALQTNFIIARAQAALPNILAAAPAADRTRIHANYHKVAATAHGTYALIDYVNFKGDGTNPAERYRGHGWGLLHVLREMHTVPAGQPAAAEFAAAAKRCLDRRIANSPPARGEARWRQGWHHRCDTYARPL